MSVLTVRPLGEVLHLDVKAEKVDTQSEYRIAGVRSFGNGVFGREVIRGNETSYKTLHRLAGGAFVMSRLKAFEGAIAYISGEFDGCYASPEFPTFTIDGEYGDPRYVKHIFTWPRFWGMLKGESKGIGARRERVSAERLLGIEVPLPEVAEQRRIAGKLDAAMGCIHQIAQAKERSRSLTLQHADSLFRSIETQAPLSRALTESSDFVVVDPSASYQTAGILNRGRGLFLRPVINGSDTKYPRYNRLRKDQFVYSKLFGWEGSLGVVPEEFSGVHVSHEFPTFDIDPAVADVEYVTHLARWCGLHDKLKDQGTGMGHRRQRVNVGRLLAAEVPLPDLAEQRRIARQLTLARRVADSGTAQVQQLADLRRALLDAAFGGRL